MLSRNWAAAIVLLAVAALIAGCATTPEVKKEVSMIRITGSPPPRQGQPGVLAGRIQPSWMEEGYFQLRFPETLQSNLGLFFIDHYRPDMIPVVKLEKFPEWQFDENGVASYFATLPNNIDFSGKLIPGPDYVDMVFSVTNRREEPLRNVYAQVCLSMGNATGFSKQLDVSSTFIPVDGEFIALSETHPTAAELGRPPWINVLTKEVKDFRGPRVNAEAGWWVVEEQADYALIARVSEESSAEVGDARELGRRSADTAPAKADGKHLVGIAFRGATGVMSNSRIPCLHSGPPAIPIIPPGESRAITGRMYLMSASLKDLKKRFEADILGE